MSPKPKRTEPEMIALLRARHGEVGGNGQAFAFITGVRSAAGFDAKRTLDAVSMSLWPSRGLILDGFEIKCSRSDWQRELKKPEKAEEFARLLDRFWIVAGDDEIVRDGELPEGWGLLVPRGKALAAIVQPTLLHDYPAVRTRPLPPGFNRSFLAALLREAVRVGEATPEAIREARAAGIEDARRDRVADREAYKPLYEELNAFVREFEKGLGVSIRKSFTWNGADPTMIGNAVRAALSGENDFSSLRRRYVSLADNAERIAAEVRRRAELLLVDEPSGKEEPHGYR